MNDRVAQQLAEAICLLSCTLRELGEQKENKAILCRLAEMEDRIMSQISEFAGRVNAKFDEISTSVDEVVASQVGIAADVTSLKDLILKLQTTPGPISAEDQATLDAAEARVNALASKTAAVSAALKELDAATESAPPAPPA